MPSNAVVQAKLIRLVKHAESVALAAAKLREVAVHASAEGFTDGDDLESLPLLSLIDDVTMPLGLFRDELLRKTREDVDQAEPVAVDIPGVESLPLLSLIDDVTMPLGLFRDELLRKTREDVDQAEPVAVDIPGVAPISEPPADS